MRCLIVYATNSGSTYLVGRTIDNWLSKKHDVRFINATEVHSADYTGVDCIIIGSPSWLVQGSEGQPHPAIGAFLAHLDTVSLGLRRWAIFGCGDRSYTRFCGAVDIMEQCVKNLNGTLLVPSLRIDEYYFNLQRSEVLVHEWVNGLLKKL